MSSIKLKTIYEKGCSGSAVLPLYRNPPIDLYCKPMRWFLCNGNTRWVQIAFQTEKIQSFCYLAPKNLSRVDIAFYAHTYLPLKSTIFLWNIVCLLRRWIVLMSIYKVFYWEILNCETKWRKKLFIPNINSINLYMLSAVLGFLGEISHHCVLALEAHDFF